MRKVRVAVVGYGQIGPVHVRSYKKHEDKVEVTVVVDLLEERRKSAQEQFGIKDVAADYNEVLKRDDIDAVSVCIPTYQHHDLVLAAARHGKHVFCEKPMCMSMEDAYEMEEVCKKAGVKLQLGFVRRYDNQWLKFKEIVKSGTVGKPVVWRSARAGYGAPSTWFFQRELGGGPFIDGAVHNYDFGNYMFGKVAYVSAHGSTIQPDRTGVDTGIAEVVYESGDRLQLMWSWGLKRGVRGGSVHDVLGQEGALVFNAPNKNPLTSENPDVQYLTVNRENGIEEPFAYDRNDMFADQMGDFIDTIIQDKEPKVSAKHGQEALKVGLSLLKSFETGKSVFL